MKYRFASRSKSGSLIMISLMLSLSMILHGCDDDPTSAIDGGDAPEIPRMDSAPQVDDSYFQENDPQMSLQQTEQTDTDYLPYSFAREIVINHAAVMAVEPHPFVVLNQIDVEPEQENGRWVWDYSGDMTLPGEDIAMFEILLTADVNEAQNEAFWEMVWSYDDPETGDTESFTYLDMTISLDHERGEWNMYSPDHSDIPEDSPVLEIDYETTADDEHFVHHTYHESEDVSQDLFELIYEQEENEHTFRILETEDGVTEETIITWDTDSGTGSVDAPGMFNCDWREDLQITECDEEPQMSGSVEERIEQLMQPELTEEQVD